MMSTGLGVGGVDDTAAKNNSRQDIAEEEEEEENAITLSLTLSLFSLTLWFT